jgi:hypothetical protein
MRAGLLPPIDKVSVDVSSAKLVEVTKRDTWSGTSSTSSFFHQDTRIALGEALCSGLFHNVAKLAEGQGYFRTMEGEPRDWTSRVPLHIDASDVWAPVCAFPGNASVVLVHPSSAFFEKQEQLKWVVFFEVVWTSKVCGEAARHFAQFRPAPINFPLSPQHCAAQPFMRVVCPIRYEWVKFLLPKLRQVEVRSLSTTGKVSAVALA